MMLEVVEQGVTQHESTTLKSVTPWLTRFFIRSFFRRTNPDISADEYSGSLALVQWLLSLQQRENRYRGSGGSMMQGLFPLAFIIGVMFSTTFLKISGGVTTTLPARWNLLLLLKGREVVPSNCSKRTELLPRRSNTKAAEFLAASSTVDTFFLCFQGKVSSFSGQGVQK